MQQRGFHLAWLRARNHDRPFKNKSGMAAVICDKGGVICGKDGVICGKDGVINL